MNVEHYFFRLLLIDMPSMHEFPATVLFPMVPLEGIVGSPSQCTETELVHALEIPRVSQMARSKSLIPDPQLASTLRVESSLVDSSFVFTVASN